MSLLRWYDYYMLTNLGGEGILMDECEGNTAALIDQHRLGACRIGTMGGLTRLLW